jgi:hypothetical protein
MAGSRVRVRSFLFCRVELCTTRPNSGSLGLLALTWRATLDGSTELTFLLCAIVGDDTFDDLT